MNSENLDQSQNTSTQKNQDNISEPNSHIISEDTKKLLISLLKKRLDNKITKLENKGSEEEEALKYVAKKYSAYLTLLKSFSKETEKNLKSKKELLKKNEEEKKSKEIAKPHLSKSLAPHKKLEISTRNDFLTNRTVINKNKNKINANINNISRHNYQTEISKKDHERPKTFKGRRIPLEKDSNTKIKPKPIKLDKITNISTPLRPEDNKAKTIANYNTETKPESRTIHNRVIFNNKSKSIKKKGKENNLQLSQNFSDVGKSMKKIDKFTSEKANKKSINIIQDKLNKKNENKDIKENKKDTGKKLVNKKINDKIKKTQIKNDTKEEKKEDKKISKDESKEIKEEKKNQDNKEEKEKEKEKENENVKENEENINKETNEEKINKEKKEEIKLNNEEKKDDIENKSENKEKIEEKEEKANNEESKKQDETKKEEKNNEENKAEIEKETKIENENNNLDTLKDEKVNESNKKDENQSDNKVDKTPEIPKEENKKDSEKKEENKIENEPKETPKEIKSITPEEILQNELKNEEQKIIQENETNSLVPQKEDLPINNDQNKTEEKESEQKKDEPLPPANPSENKNTPPKKIEEIREENNPNEIKNENENKPNNKENNINLIATLRKDNEEMKKEKENDDELLKHYQSQLLDINLNQSINQNMSFSQSFLNSRSILGEKPLEKIKLDPNAPLTKDDIIKKYKNYFIYIFDFLDFKERVMFSGIHKGFKSERIYLLNTKREEAIASLELNERETITDRLNKFMSTYSSTEYTQPIGPFTVARNSATAILSIDKPAFNKIFQQKTLDIKLSEVYIVYRVLFVLFGEQKIAEIIDDTEFWEKCIEYLNSKSTNNKIGSFILEKSKSFDFSKNSIYLINKLLVGIKPNFTTAHFSKINGPTGLVMFIIRDALEYAGIIVAKKTPKSRIYNNLVYYKNLIENLSNFIDYLASIDKK